MKHRVRLACFVGAAFLVLLAIWRVNTQSRWRAEWEHGIKLPDSATRFQCAGDAYLVLDRGASTVFEMAASDVPELKKRLTIRPIWGAGAGPTGGFVLPWGDAEPLETLVCESPTGDFLHVEIYPMDSGRVGISMDTDWN